jgi:hypothetical protein
VQCNILAKYCFDDLGGFDQKNLIFKELSLFLKMLHVRNIYRIAVPALRRGRTFSVSSLYLGRGFDRGLFF